MMSRASGPLLFFANLVAFSACAMIAFARNVNALFYHFDGSYLLVDARDQLKFGQPSFEYSNNFLQSIGNIQLPQNARLLPFYWPIGWFSETQAGKIACYLIIAAIVFATAYWLARLMSQPQAVAFAAAWILGVVTTPFVPAPFFYPILSVAPDYVVIVAAPVVAFWLMDWAGRSPSLLADATAALGLAALAFYLLAAASLILPILAVGMLPYVVLALVLARTRSELLRKLAVLAAVAIIAVLLRWPWYVLGLFLDTAPNFFPGDFIAIYSDSIYASVLFHYGSFGLGGPLLVVSSVLGAFLSLRSADPRLRAAAWILLALVATFLVAGIALSLVPHWIFPPPIYFEGAAWPLYAMFSAIMLNLGLNFIAGRIAILRLRNAYPVGPQFILLAAIFVLAAVFIVCRPPTVLGYPFPPRLSPVAAFLRENIALDSASSFRGRLLTAVPLKPDGGDAWPQQIHAAMVWAWTAGNDEMSVGLWYHRIPTLFEYNQFMSPAFHALVKRALQRPPIVHERNITILTYPDVHVLKLLGVRYVLTPHPDGSLGELRASEDRAGEPWGLIELSKPNLATYSPTSVETRRDLSSMLDFVVDDSIDLSKQAVAQERVPGPLTPVRAVALSMAGKDLRVVADSDGRSLIVVPVEFSHCLDLIETPPEQGGGATALRIDGLLTGIVFAHHIDAVLSFRIGPLHDPTCRWADYRDLKALIPGTGAGH
jgi:hypothetical protein